MKVPIDSIQVDTEHRIRKDLGDLKLLQESLQKVGLLNPILVDENSKLIAGYRRLLACRNLGWKEVEVRQVPFAQDPLIELDAEAAENLYRKDFTFEEVLNIEKRRQEILRSLRGNIFQRCKRWLVNLWKRIFRKKTPRG